MSETDNISLFDSATDENSLLNCKKINVVKLEYIDAEIISWQELFEGFDELKAITFSSGINFIYTLLNMFQKAEIIFGCEDVMSFSLQNIMAYQSRLIERIRDKFSSSKEKLITRIENGSVHLYVAREQLSHEKIYLLSGGDGRKRVILGSANMSFNAFSGRQRENICYIDGEKAYDWYLNNFNSLKEDSTDEISHKAYTLSDLSDNIDKLPVSETIRAKKVLIIEPEKENIENIEFYIDVRRTSEKLKQNLPKLDSKNGKVCLIPDNIVKIRKHIEIETIKEKEQRAEYPQLVINTDDSTATLNNEKLDLHPEPEKIKQDVDLFLQYMKGYEKFHGETDEMKNRYYEFANWFFCSPFMAVMRDYAARFDQKKFPYPVFGLIYGQSKAGKTSFLETLLKMMIGQKPKISAPDFTRSSIETLKRTVLGAPIIVDDLTNARFNQHAIETIKNDDFGIRDHLINYPAVVISANEDVKAVAPEVIRRTVICRVGAGLTNTEVMKSNVVRNVQQKIGTSFYREYLRRMLEKIPDMINLLKDENSESSPDIMELSSEIIKEIISKYTDELPSYVKHLNLDNYFNEHVTGKHAIKTIREAWTTSRKSFKIDKKSNKIKYNTGASYEAERLIKELPENLEPFKNSEWVIMNLAEAQKFFHLSFKKGLFIR